MAGRVPQHSLPAAAAAALLLLPIVLHCESSVNLPLSVLLEKYCEALSARTNVTGPYCNATTDQIGTCWPRTSAGELVERPCPEFFNGIKYNTTKMKHSKIPNFIKVAHQLEGVNTVAFPVNESFCIVDTTQTWKYPNCMKNLHQTQSSRRHRSMANQAAQVLVLMGLFLCLIVVSMHVDIMRQVVHITTDQLIKGFGWTYPGLVSILSAVML